VAGSDVGVLPFVDVMAPPELLIVTSGPVAVLTIVSDGDNGVVVPVIDVDVCVVVVELVPVTEVADADEGEDSGATSVVLVLSPVEAEDSPSVVAQAKPGTVPTAEPMPSATASAPMRPMDFAHPIRRKQTSPRWAPDSMDTLTMTLPPDCPRRCSEFPDVSPSFGASIPPRHSIRWTVANYEQPHRSDWFNGVTTRCGILAPWPLGATDAPVSSDKRELS
jgi:hypothetical protein